MPGPQADHEFVHQAGTSACHLPSRLFVSLSEKGVCQMSRIMAHPPQLPKQALAFNLAAAAPQTSSKIPWRCRQALRRRKVPQKQTAPRCNPRDRSSWQSLYHWKRHAAPAAEAVLGTKASAPLCMPARKSKPLANSQQNDFTNPDACWIRAHVASTLLPKKPSEVQQEQRCGVQALARPAEIHGRIRIKIEPGESS